MSDITAALSRPLNDQDIDVLWLRFRDNPNRDNFGRVLAALTPAPDDRDAELARLRADVAALAPAARLWLAGEHPHSCEPGECDDQCPYPAARAVLDRLGTTPGDADHA